MFVVISIIAVIIITTIIFISVIMFIMCIASFLVSGVVFMLSYCCDHYYDHDRC